jgi:hypothetical protein
MNWGEDMAPTGGRIVVNRELQALRRQIEELQETQRCKVEVESERVPNSDEEEVVCRGRSGSTELIFQRDSNKP